MRHHVAGQSILALLNDLLIGKSVSIVKAHVGAELTLMEPNRRISDIVQPEQERFHLAKYGAIAGSGLHSDIVRQFRQKHQSIVRMYKKSVTFPAIFIMSDKLSLPRAFQVKPVQPLSWHIR